MACDRGRAKALGFWLCSAAVAAFVGWIEKGLRARCSQPFDIELPSERVPIRPVQQVELPQTNARKEQPSLPRPRRRHPRALGQCHRAARQFPSGQL